MKKLGAAFFPLGVLSAALGIGQPASASTVRINFTADVSVVNDSASLLGGAIKVGDTLTGQYVYETTTVDSNLDSTVGDYRHTSAPFGIRVNGGGLEFATDPANVSFLVEIVDRPTGDNYLLLSYNNLQLGPDVYIEPISWQLDDPSGTAVSSDALPPGPPTLADYDQILGLRISGYRDDPFDGPSGPTFDIQAKVTSITPDTDGDGTFDDSDNCTEMANPDQFDGDSDGYGNVCDADLNNSGGLVNFPDLAIFRAAFGTENANADLNNSGGFVNFPDLAIFRSLFGKAPGPSGLDCAGTVPCPP